MPGGGGMAVVQARRRAPVVVPHRQRVRTDLLDVVAAGAVGYLLKSTRLTICALAHARREELVFSRSSPRRSSASTAAHSHHRRRRVAAAERTQREVLAHVAAASRTGPSATRQFISPKTVENHVRNAMAKLHLARRHEADPLGRRPASRSDHPRLTPPTAAASPTRCVLYDRSRHQWHEVSARIEADGAGDPTLRPPDRRHRRRRRLRALGILPHLLPPARADLARRDPSVTGSQGRSRSWPSCWPGDARRRAWIRPLLGRPPARRSWRCRC